VSYTGTDAIRIKTEYERRARELPQDFYSLAKPGNLLIHQHTQKACIQVLRNSDFFPLTGRRVVDIGCGVGTWLLEFAQWGADPAEMAGIDLMPDRVARARQRLPQSDLRIGSAGELPWVDESFDLATQMLVFENISDPVLERAMAAEMLRVVKPGGGILWFDLRVGNPKNPEVKGFRKHQIRALFPGCDAEIRPAVLAPPLSRSIAPHAWWAAEALSALPFLRTHYAAFLRKPIK
jgi:ubiquinone/menaquinone biosynthesis C-methylase UbiE